MSLYKNQHRIILKAEKFTSQHILKIFYKTFFFTIIVTLMSWVSFRVDNISYNFQYNIIVFLFLLFLGLLTPYVSKLEFECDTRKLIIQFNSPLNIFKKVKSFHINNIEIQNNNLTNTFESLKIKKTNDKTIRLSGNSKFFLMDENEINDFVYSVHHCIN